MFFWPRPEILKFNSAFNNTILQLFSPLNIKNRLTWKRRLFIFHNHYCNCIIGAISQLPPSSEPTSIVLYSKPRRTAFENNTASCLWYCILLSKNVSLNVKWKINSRIITAIIMYGDVSSRD